MIYRYIARDPMGRRVEGELEASTQEDVTKELKGRALEPISIRLMPSRDRMIPEERIEMAREEPVETEIFSTEPEASAAEKGGFSRWFGVILLFVYLLMQYCG